MIERDVKGRFVHGYFNKTDNPPYNKGLRLRVDRKYCFKKRNKARATAREKKSMDWLSEQGYVILEYYSSYYPFDFLVEKDGKKIMIEHKSCLEKVYSSEKKERVVHGRFKIIVENHNNLAQLSKEQGSIPMYLFHMIKDKKDIFVLKEWEGIDKLIKANSRRYFLPIKSVFK